MSDAREDEEKVSCTFEITQVCVCDIGVLMLKRSSTCLNGANLNFQTQPKLANDVIDGKRD